MYRDAGMGGFFSYEMKVDNSVKNYLQVKYYSGDVGRTFKIYANDTVIADVTLENVNPDNFYDVRYEIPAELIDGAETVVIKFETVGNSFAGGIFDRLYIVKDYSTNAGLSNVVVNGNTYDKIADEMTVYVTEDSETAKIKFNILDSYGLVYVDDILIDDVSEYEVALSGDTTQIKVLVKAEDHENSKEYTITIEKDNEGVKANAASNGIPPVVIVLIVVAVVAIAGVGGFIYFKKIKKVK